MLAPNVIEGLPDDLQQEVKTARQRQNDERMKQQRKLHPTIQDLLTPFEANIALHGTHENRADFFSRST